MTAAAPQIEQAPWEGVALALLRLDRMPGRQLHELFILNIALQLFDGVATSHGLACWREGNPIIRAAIQALGAEQALLLWKAQACGWLLLLRRSPAPRLAGPALAAGAGLYLALSFVPWMTRFLSLVWS